MSNLAGLTSQQAAQFLEKDGPNRIGEGPRFTWQWLLLKQFTSPAIVVLIISAVIYGALGNEHDAFILLAIIIPSGLLTFVQEFRAEGTMARLRERLAVRVRVIRDGKEQEIPIAGVVRGDLVMLAPGDLVPADLLLVESTSLSIDEAALTGEAFPRHKSLTDEKELFMGTHVVGGSGIARVVRTGTRTKFGEMAERITSRDVSTSFEKGIRDFGFMVARAITILVIFVFTGNLILHRPALESLLFSLALAVGLTPQMLPVIISVCLSAGARALSKKKLLIKRLDAIEDLGTMQFLCTDKTGTLTTGNLSVELAIDVTGNSSQRVHDLAYENSALQGSSSNAIDAAILLSRKPAQLRKKIGEIDFTFKRRRISVITEDGECITKGAFQEVLERSTSIRVGDGVESIVAKRAKLLTVYEKWARVGYKIIAVATKPNVRPSDSDIEQELIFEGMVLINDPPKSDAKSSVSSLKELGIEVVLITGDSLVSAKHVAGEVGIPEQEIIRGEELNALSDVELANSLSRVRVFAEIDPLQKLRIVTILKRSNSVVGFLGDGINDAAALHLSDVAISVDDAVDVAKNASSVVLLEKDLLVIAEGVKVGRRTFENTMKYVRITISASFGNVISMALASFFLPFLPMLPTQILLLNFLSDLPAIAISSDRVDEEDLEHARRWTMREIARFMVFFGVISSIFDLLVFFISLNLLHAEAPELRSTWFACSLWTEVIAIVVLRTRRRSWQSIPSKPLLALGIFVIVIAMSVPLFGIFRAFDLPRVALPFTAQVVLLSAFYAALTEIGKHRTRFFV